VNNLSAKNTRIGTKVMIVRDDGEVAKPPPRDLRSGQTTGPISSLNEAWLHTLDTCVSDGPLNGVILPLMRNCFFGGAMHSVFLLQRGQGDQLVVDIAEFMKEEPQ
jgi:hypothetical protein